MTMLVLILILIPIGLIAASIKSKGKTRKILLLLLTVTLLIPICLILLIKPAQQGKILPQWGKISLLFSEPEDLRQPLAEVPLEQKKNIYTFTLLHKSIVIFIISIALLIFPLI